VALCPAGPASCAQFHRPGPVFFVFKPGFDVLSIEVEGMKIDVSALRYEEIERVLADLPFQARQLTAVGGRVVLDCAV